MYLRPAPLSRVRHGGKALLPLTSYNYAAGTPVQPAWPAEAGSLAPELPLVFGRFEAGAPLGLFVLLGLSVGRALTIAPNGRWLGRVVPAAVRRYPFILAQAGTERQMIGIDEACDRLVDGGGEPLFDDDGNPAAVVTEAQALLNTLNTQSATKAATCSALERHGLLVPFDLTAVASGLGGEPIGGLKRIDETRLQALPDDAFLELRRNGALALAYIHLVSLGQVARLRELGQAVATVTGQNRPIASSLVEGSAIEFNF